ncbi:hypothetical protein MJT46_009950 [Ovis ammon polii x Ovis aries]|nr:hypothetical protein MJT46_009950 [Ovis ammon polii x Ovis aries]
MESQPLDLQGNPESQTPPQTHQALEPGNGLSGAPPTFQCRESPHLVLTDPTTNKLNLGPCWTYDQQQPTPSLNAVMDTPSPGDRRPDPFQYPASNGLALNPTQQEMLAHQALPRKSHPAAQESEAQNEIAPEDIKYRLETLPEAPLQLQHLSYFGKPRPPWIPLSTTYGESHKPWTYHGEEPSHSGDHYLTAHQIAFQNSPLGQSMFPVYIQGRNIASLTHPDYRDCVNQHQRDFQAPECNQVLKPDPDKSSQGIKCLIYLLSNPWKKESRLTAPLVHSGSSKPSSKPELAASNASRTVGLNPERTMETLVTEAMRMRWVNLCKPKVNSIKCETHILPLLSRGKHSGTKETLSHSQVSPAAHEPVPDIFMPKTGLNTEKKREKEREIGRKKLPK